MLKMLVHRFLICMFPLLHLSFIDNRLVFILLSPVTVTPGTHYEWLINSSNLVQVFFIFIYSLESKRILFSMLAIIVNKTHLLILVIMLWGSSYCLLYFNDDKGEMQKRKINQCHINKKILSQDLCCQAGSIAYTLHCGCCSVSLLKLPKLHTRNWKASKHIFFIFTAVMKAHTCIRSSFLVL